MKKKEYESNLTTLMKYTEEMILQSESGYCIPFEERQGKDVKLSLGYGEQTDPATASRNCMVSIINFGFTFSLSR